MLRSTRNRFLSAITLAALILSPACRPKRASERQDYLPETGRAEGWDKSSATRMFEADRLYEYIDGDADRYLNAGFERVLTSDYRYRGKIDAVADIFVMKEAAGAAGVLESHPAQGSQPVEIGDGARLYPGTLMLRKGRFFVRVVAYDEGPEVPGALLLLGRAVADGVK